MVEEILADCRLNQTTLAANLQSFFENRFELNEDFDFEDGSVLVAGV